MNHEKTIIDLLDDDYVELENGSVTLYDINENEYHIKTRINDYPSAVYYGEQLDFDVYFNGKPIKVDKSQIEPLLSDKLTRL